MGRCNTIYFKVLEKRWCVCRDQGLLDFPLSNGPKRGVVGSAAMACGTLDEHWASIMGRFARCWFKGADLLRRHVSELVRR